ncbi:SpoIIE family protein phosphatase [candidate division KSB1 bacterium]|nr:SpoIIE family protein phosphatase [candidate division KSB1 bacterium]
MFEKLFPKLRISLKIKITFLFLMLVLGMMAAVTYIFTIREMNLRAEQVSLRMERLANNIATIRSVETEDWEMYQSYIDNQIRLNPDIVYIAIFDDHNKLQASSLNLDWIDVDNARPLNSFEQVNIVTQLDQRQIAAESQQDLEAKSVNILIGDQNLGTVKVGFSLVELNDAIRQNLIWNLELAAIFTVIAIIASYYTSHRIVIPLNRLTNAMMRISQGDLDQQVTITSRDEIGEMTDTFNYMTRGLREKSLIETFSHELGFTIELKKICDLMVQRIVNGLSSRQGYLFIRHTTSNPESFQLISAFPHSFEKTFACNRDETLCYYLKSTARPLPLYLMSKYSDFAQKVRISAYVDDNSLVCPILIKQEVAGILLLATNESHTSFSDEEKSFLATLLGQGAFAIESALLYEELTEQERLKRELEIARAVQNRLLPQDSPHISALDISGICIPATEIGGDYFDYFQLSDHTLGIVIADVTGKGTSAAFYMAMVKGMMLSLTHIYNSPKELLCELNRRLYGSMDQKVFVTMIYAVLNWKRRTLVLARAGHNALLIKRCQDCDIDVLIPPGIGLGLEQGILFNKTIEEQTVKLKSEDCIVFYTDGISEAMNEHMDEFGEEELIRTIANSEQRAADAIQHEVLNAISAFTNNAPQHDDMTMITVSVT